MDALLEQREEEEPLDDPVANPFPESPYEEEEEIQVDEEPEVPEEHGYWNEHQAAPVSYGNTEESWPFFLAKSFRLV